jgi:DNA-binding CsgD family transcriptional regulator
MNALEKIEAFITAVNAAENLEDVFKILSAQIERLGFERFTYELTWTDKTIDKRPLFISNYPSEWLNHYIAERYASDDMVCRYSAQVIRPFLWSEVGPLNRLTEKQRLVFNEASDAGLSAGGAIPIFGPGTVKAYLSVANNMPRDSFDKLFVQVRHELHLLATYAHERIINLDIDQPPKLQVKLTPRETEVLTWTARGKTRWEISEILKISDETVKAHIDNANAKLNTYNKTHATAVALIHGLIAP